MRQTRTTIAILAALAMCICCTQDDDRFPTSIGEGRKVFHATICSNGEAPDTKTFLDSDLRMHWTEKDSISIFAGGVGNMLHEFEGQTGATSGSFRHLSGDPGTGLTRNIALFPYSSETVIESDGTLIFRIPQTQRYVEGSFDPKSFPMLAVTSDTEDLDLRFKNLFGILKLQIKGAERIKKITLRGNFPFIPFSGIATIETEGNESLSISGIQHGATLMVLDCGSGVQLDPSTPTSFHIALPPCVLTGGFTITMEDTDGGYMEKSTSSTLTVTRNNIHPMTAFTYEAESSDFLGRWYSTNCGKQPYGDFYKFGDNPCPSGYRVPTKEELEELVTYPHKWKHASSNPGGVNGMWFGPTNDAVNSATAANPNGCLFFPAAGYHEKKDGGISHSHKKGKHGDYCSSTEEGIYHQNPKHEWEYDSWANVYSMYFDENKAYVGWGTSYTHYTEKHLIGREWYDVSYYIWIMSSVRCIK